jgi:hypothetical protein
MRHNLPHYKPSKYKNVRCVRDGIKFDSIKEADYYSYVVVPSLTTGRFLMCLRQVPFHLPGGVIYRLDFLEFHADGTVHAVDVKGTQTKEFIIKKKQVEALYPIVIELK